MTSVPASAATATTIPKPVAAGAAPTTPTSRPATIAGTPVERWPTR
ncbi:hypothetical protein [Herbidospora galbida]|nr:hypothetical protein [Herbidospora galbida]